jgi:transcriptional regulator with XRE-family HTH domain
VSRRHIEDFYVYLADRLRTARLAAGRTQRQVALAIGVDDALIGEYENAQARVYTHRLAAICLYLDVDPGDLLVAVMKEGVDLQGGGRTRKRKAA